jgi:hypothetical protein
MKKQFKMLWLIATVSILMVGCEVKENHEIIVEMASDLQIASDIWVKNGRPKDFDPSSTLKSSTEQLYVFTNGVQAAGNYYHCHFAIKSSRIEEQGFMTISDDGMLLWIRDSDGKAIVSPEKNGIKF